MHVLVLLRELSGGGDAADVDHAPFIDDLIERDLVVLGGAFVAPPLPGVFAGYLLRCSDVTTAEEILADDPLLTSGACEAIVTEWDLVGLDPDFADPD
jgi:hypothetical protein